MAILVILGFLLPMHIEGCSPVPSLSLSLFPGDHRPSNYSALKCQLCQERKMATRQELTFSYILDGTLKHSMKRQDTSALLYLGGLRNFYGLWQCRVEEYPNLTADYYLGPVTPNQPAKEEASEEESLLLGYTVPSKLIVAIVAAAVLLILLVTVTAITSCCCLVTYYRKQSTVRRSTRERQRSDNFPLTENADHNTNAESGADVSYVELVILQKPSSRNPPRPSDTIYANIM